MLACLQIEVVAMSAIVLYICLVGMPMLFEKMGHKMEHRNRMEHQGKNKVT